MRKSLASRHQCGKGAGGILSPLLNFPFCPKHLTNFSAIKNIYFARISSLSDLSKNQYSSQPPSEKFNLKTHTMEKSAPRKISALFSILWRHKTSLSCCCWRRQRREEPLSGRRGPLATPQTRLDFIKIRGFSMR